MLHIVSVPDGDYLTKQAALESTSSLIGNRHTWIWTRPGYWISSKAFNTGFRDMPGLKSSAGGTEPGLSRSPSAPTLTGSSTINCVNNKQGQSYTNYIHLALKDKSWCNFTDNLANNQASKCPISEVIQCLSFGDAPETSCTPTNSCN